MPTEKQRLTLHIMEVVQGIYNLMGPAVPEEWLSSDLTVTQLRLLLVLHSYGPLRMSDISTRLKVTLPTATVIVDHLVHKNLVLREASPEDRRLVICKLSPEARTLINKLWGSGQMAIKTLLASLSAEQMQKAAEVADILYQSALNLAKASQQSGGTLQE